MIFPLKKSKCNYRCTYLIFMNDYDSFLLGANNICVDRHQARAISGVAAQGDFWHEYLPPLR